MTPFKNAILLTCPTCQQQSAVSAKVAITAFIVWECAACGDCRPPILSLKQTTWKYAN